MKFHCGKIAGRWSHIFENTGVTTVFGSKRSLVRIQSPRPTYLIVKTHLYLGKRRSAVSHSIPVIHGFSGSFWPSIAGKLRDTRILFFGLLPNYMRSFRAKSVRGPCVPIGILSQIYKSDIRN